MSSNGMLSRALSITKRSLQAAEEIAGGGPSIDVEKNIVITPVDLDAGEILFVLATNFLLYAALVLITYLVVKLYIESSPDNPLFNEDVTYNRIPTRQSGVDLSQPGVEMKPMGTAAAGTGGSKRRSLLNFTQPDDESPLERGEVIKKVVLLGASLIVTFVIWGVLQERILKAEYGEGDFFTYSYGLVFSNRALGLIFSAVIFHYQRPTWSKAVAYEYSLPAVTNMLSSWCQYEALKYVTFPTQVLSKAFKIAPIMLMGRLLGNKNYPLYDYVVAGTIGLGVLLFVTGTEGLELGSDSFGQTGAIGCGLLLLGLYLVFDSFTSQWQSRMFTKHREMMPVQMMLVMNAFSSVFSFITLVHGGDLVPFFAFISAHPEIHLHFIAFSICSTIGQLLIFITIRSFGAVVFAIIMTVRIALSILVSCIIYDHNMTERATLGLVVVFSAVAYRIQRRLQGKRLVTWQGIDDSKGPELFSAWHEHLDF